MARAKMSGQKWNASFLYVTVKQVSAWFTRWLKTGVPKKNKDFSLFFKANEVYKEKQLQEKTSFNFNYKLLKELGNNWKNSLDKMK